MTTEVSYLGSVIIMTIRDYILTTVDIKLINPLTELKNVHLNVSENFKKGNIVVIAHSSEKLFRKM